LAPVFRRGKPVVILGGDNSLSFPNIQALCDAVNGRIGLIVVDAHYDVRPIPENGQPTSGTPYRRVIEELGRRVRPANIVELGIRPFANSRSLAEYAAKKGVRVFSAADLRSLGIEQATEAALEAAGDGVDHLFLSFDADALDQSIAPGVSAPGAGGLVLEQATHIMESVAADPRCRGMDLVEVAPNLDPTGNTARVAAQLVAHFAGGLARRTA
jgi:formimidoylglutamase